MGQAASRRAAFAAVRRRAASLDLAGAAKKVHGQNMTAGEEMAL
jgi:hypothetical protein